MEYSKGNTYFNIGESIKQYPYLDRDISCDILIIGGGINGAIVNYELSKHYNTVLVDKSRLGYGCTSLATALLEYQLDQYAKELSNVMSEEEVVSVYDMGLESLARLKAFIATHGNYCDYVERPTLIYSNNILNAKDIEEEYMFRKKHGYNVQLLDSQTNPFPFKICKAVYSEDGGAELNPYLFTKQLIDNSNNHAQIYENTNIINVEKIRNGLVAYTNYGNQITCNKVIYCTGFNWEIVSNQHLCDKFVSYSIVTNAVNAEWYHNTLIQDAKHPYHYLRTLPDGRIIYGGQDIPNKNTPIKVDKAEKQYAKLLQSLRKMFPKYTSLTAEYKFAGFFGATKNDLGLIGAGELDGEYLFLSVGANGIVNALCGVDILVDSFEHRTNKWSHLFDPHRK